MNMEWWQIIVLVIIGLVIFKFIVKPIFKVAGLILLGFIAWWLIGGI